MKPNIALITIDCWRGDHIGVASDAKVTTPHLDSLAEQSHYFANAYSCGGWTKIAMTSLFTSTHASMYGFTQGKLSPDRPVLAETLSDNGYITAGFNTNPVCGKASSFDRGFQHFEDLKPQLRDTKTLLHKARNNRIVSRLAPSAPPYPSTSAEELVAKASKWLSQERDQPYFLWLHFMDLHWPYASSQRPKSWQEARQMRLDRQQWRQVKDSHGKHDPGQERAERWRQLYAEETEALDRELGKLFTELRKRDDWDNTALCVTNDHGEELYEHNTWAHSWNQLHHEGTHAPLIIKTPGQSTASRVGELVSQLDISPTLLKTAGVDVPKKMLGRDLLAKPTTEDSSTAPIFMEMLGHRDSHKYRLSIRTQDHHYIYDADHDKCYLYWLADDQDSRHNLYQHSCAISKHFDALRLSHVAKGALNMLKNGVVVGEDEMSYNLDDDPMVIERLRALGYVD